MTTAAETNYLISPRGLKSWLLTLDHKRIGVMYFASIMFFFALGGLLAVLIRTELLSPDEILIVLKVLEII